MTSKNKLEMGVSTTFQVSDIDIRSKTTQWDNISFARIISKTFGFTILFVSE